MQLPWELASLTYALPGSNPPQWHRTRMSRQYDWRMCAGLRASGMQLPRELASLPHALPGSKAPKI